VFVLTANVREVDGVSVVDLDGRISLGEAAEKLRETVDGLQTQGKKRILLNLAGVTYADSAGIGALAEALNVVTTGGGQLKLFNLPRRIKDLLRLSGLFRLFEVYDDEHRAIRSFQS